MEEFLDRMYGAKVKEYIINHKEEIIKFIENSQEEFTLDLMYKGINDFLKSMNNSSQSTNLPLIFQKDKILTAVESDELNKIIYQHLSKNITKLNININFLRKNLNLFKDFQNIDSVEIFDEISIDDVDFLNQYKNVQIQCGSIDYFEDVKDKFYSDIGIISNTTSKCAITNDKIFYSSKMDYDSTIAKLIISDISGELFEKCLNFINSKFNNLTSFEIIKRNTDKNIDDITMYIHKDEDGLKLEYDMELGLDFLIKWISNLNDNKIIKNNSLKKIVLKMENRTYSELEKIKEITDNYEVEINYGGTQNTTIEKFDQMRNIMDSYKELIINANCSPAEKIMYAYDLIKWYEYNEDYSNLSNARNIADIINSGHIVCAGYSEFLCQLLKEIGIPSSKISVNSPFGPHARVLIEVNDDKYNIHGTYAFDPTFDSSRIGFLKQQNDKRTAVTEYDLSNNELKISNDNFEKFTDSNSIYRNIFITKDNYLSHFTEEKLPDMNTAEQYNVEGEKTIEEFVQSERINKDILMRLIYITRLKEGYTKEQMLPIMNEIITLNDKKWNEEKTEKTRTI